MLRTCMYKHMPMGICDHAWILLFCGTFPEAVCNNTRTVRYGKTSVFVDPCLAKRLQLLAANGQQLMGGPWVNIGYIS